MSFEEFLFLFLRVVFYAGIVFGLQYAIRSVVFKNVNVEYKNAVRPIIFWLLSFFAICIYSYVTTYKDAEYILQLYTSETIDGSPLAYWAAFSKLTEELAGQSDNMMKDFYYRCLMSFRISFLSGIAIFIMLTMTVYSLYVSHKYSKKTLSGFFFASILLCSATLGAFLSMGTSAVFLTDNEEISFSTLTLIGIIVFVVVLGLLACCYIKWVSKQIGRVYTMRKHVQVNYAQQPTRNQQTKSQQAEATKQCPYCGETILAVALKCKHCGEWLNKEPEKKKVPCPVCGEEIDEGTEVCPFCHEKINGEDSKPQTKECPACAEEQPASKPSDNEKKGSIAILSIIALVVIVLAASFFFIGRNGSSGDSNENTSSDNSYEEVDTVAVVDTLSADETVEDNITIDDSEIPPAEDVEEYNGSSEETNYDELNIN